MLFSGVICIDNTRQRPHSGDMETNNTDTFFDILNDSSRCLSEIMPKPLFASLEECDVCAKAGGRCYACFSDAPEIATQVLP